MLVCRFTEYLILDRFGGNPINAGSSNERLHVTQSRVSIVAAAVRANTCTEVEIKLTDTAYFCKCSMKIFPPIPPVKVKVYIIMESHYSVHTTT